MPKLMKISTFANEYFAKGNAPTLSTIRGLIDRGELAGQRELNPRPPAPHIWLLSPVHY